ncbi:MAG: 6,7-dimethyl-8-ribityllumazine synthase [Flavobacteriales bacterium]|nr:6,7-dimethyl-8-ribityllumazine synthase [Flavobacteriales bacterium]
MASSLKNLSSYNAETIPSAEGMRFAIVVSEWNTEVTEALYNGAKETLMKFGVKEDDVVRRNVPGSFELTLGAQLMAERKEFDGIICIGVVIQGETKHFDFICDAVSQGITNLNIKYNLPVIFGVLTPNTMQQALDRAGGVHGNKGDEAAITAIKMAVLKKELEA